MGHKGESGKKDWKGTCIGFGSTHKIIKRKNG
jgi:hypothetical protein